MGAEASAGLRAAIAEASEDELGAALAGLTPRKKNKLEMALTAAHAPPAGTRASISYYGHCAFVLTSASGKTVLVDPWRNHTNFKWFAAEFPALKGIDVVVSTHTHFDHDNVLACLETSPDALILQGGILEQGQSKDDDKWKSRVHITFGSEPASCAGARLAAEKLDESISITPFTDLHSCASHAAWSGHGTRSPPIGMPNSMLLFDFGGIRLLHLGDNRLRYPDETPHALFAAIGSVDIICVPADEALHCHTDEEVDEFIQMLKPSIIIPMHYYIEGITWREGVLETQAMIEAQEDPMCRYKGLGPVDGWVRHMRAKGVYDVQYVGSTMALPISKNEVPIVPQVWVFEADLRGGKHVA